MVWVILEYFLLGDGIIDNGAGEGERENRYGRLGKQGLNEKK